MLIRWRYVWVLVTLCAWSTDNLLAILLTWPCSVPSLGYAHTIVGLRHFLFQVLFTFACISLSYDTFKALIVIVVIGVVKELIFVNKEPITLSQVEQLSLPVDSRKWLFYHRQADSAEVMMCTRP